MAEYIYRAEPIGEGEYSHTLVGELVRCGECVHAPKCYGDIAMVSKGGGEKYCPVEYCSMGERRTDGE